ncbi:MAG: hypothetical protein ACOX63_07120 [Christensenellales bacterium]
MKKRFCLGIVVLFFSVALYGHAEAPLPDAQRFCKEYEIMNGQMNWDGSHAYQILELPEDNPIVYAKAEELEALLSNGTSILYLGFPECPWCRTLVPILFEAADVSTYSGNIYYYDALHDRDVLYLGDNDEVLTKKEGTNLYRMLVSKLENYLGPYAGLNDPTIKRIYFPTTVFIKGGDIIDVHISTIEGQNDAYEPLSNEQHSALLALFVERMNTMNE